jgi:hypothetical protein
LIVSGRRRVRHPQEAVVLQLRKRNALLRGKRVVDGKDNLASAGQEYLGPALAGLRRAHPKIKVTAASRMKFSSATPFKFPGILSVLSGGIVLADADPNAIAKVVHFDSITGSLDDAVDAARKACLAFLERLGVHGGKFDELRSIG